MLLTIFRSPLTLITISFPCLKTFSVDKLLILMLVLLPLKAHSQFSYKSHELDWQVFLVKPTQQSWRGQAQEWLIVSENEPKSNTTAIVTLPETDVFKIVVGNPRVQRSQAKEENGPIGINGQRTQIVYPLQVTPLIAGQLNLPKIVLTHPVTKAETRVTQISVKQPSSSDKMQFSVTRDKNEIYRGQPIKFEGLWIIDMPVEAITAVEVYLPELANKHFEWLTPIEEIRGDDKHAIGLPVNGRRVIGRWKTLKDGKVEIRFSVIVKALDAGTYSWPPASIVANVNLKISKQKNKRFKGNPYPAYFDNNFFSQDNEQNISRVLMESESTQLKVNALPAGQPENFTGIIDKPLIATEASPRQVKIGEPIQYSLTLSHPDIEAITYPHKPFADRMVSLFDLPEEQPLAQYQNQSKQWLQTLFPRQVDIASIPGFSLSYFDSQSQTYQELQVNPIAIDVSDNEQFSFAQAKGKELFKSKNTLKLDPEGVWAHRWGEALLVTNNDEKKLPIAKILRFILILLPPTLLLSLLVPLFVKRYQEVKLKKPLTRLKVALEANQDPILSLTQYFYLRCNMPPSKLSATALNEYLGGYLPDDQLMALTHWLEQYQGAKFATGNNYISPSEHQLFVIMENIDKALNRDSKPVNAPEAQSTNKGIRLTFLVQVLVGFLAALSFSAWANNAELLKLELNASKLELELSKLQQRHQDALQLSLNHPQAAAKAHREVAQKLAIFDTEANINLANLYYNIGTSWYHAKHYGHSILWLRRAEELAPNDNSIRHNLNQARGQRLDNLPENFSPPWLNHSFKLFSHPMWLLVCAVIYVYFWLGFYRSITRTAHAKVNLPLLTGLLLVASLSLVAPKFYQPANSNGVIIAADIVSRKGPGLIFAPTFKTPLNQGTEFVLVQQRDSWSEIQLSNKQKTWVPSRVIEQI